MQKTTYWQLSALTFVQFVVVGATSPMIGTYLKDTLGFSGTEVGATLTFYQLASMGAPLLAALVVDRLVAARTLYGGLQLLAGAVSLTLPLVHGFVPFTALFVVYAFLMGPTGGLVNALTLARLPDRRGQYGLIRLWGTIGWIAVAGALALLWLFPGTDRSWMFGVGALGNLVAAGGALAMKPTAVPAPTPRFELIPRRAVKVLFQPSLLKMGTLFFLSGILDRFYFIATAPYLKQLGFTDSQLMPAMTLGQVTEAALLLLTGPALRRLGLRTTMFIGLGVQVARFVLMAWNPSPVVLVGALALNGFVFAFFYAVVTVYVDEHTDPVTRGGVHQLLGLVFFGTSSVVGSLLTGLCLDAFHSATGVDYRGFWTVPAVVGVATFILVPVFFRGRHHPPKTP